jgi:SAM-dependent MidA family methyltransferase
VHSASSDIHAAIAAAGGDLPFEDFMSLALYGPHGFYTRPDGGRAGRRGDFITSAEVGPLFGTVIARALDAWWQEAGQPEKFSFVEVGAGPGTLARAIHAASPACWMHLDYIAVEVSAAQRAMHPDFITSVEVVPNSIECGVIFANELLDNLPFELWVFDSGWRKAHVTTTGDGFSEIVKNVDVPEFLPERAPHGSRIPVQRSAAQWLSSSLSRLKSGRVIVIDYCTATTTQIAGMQWREWLRTYAHHDRGVHYLKNVGDQDITTQVAIDQLVQVREPDAVRSQAQFLQLWGIGELVEEGKAEWGKSAAAPTLAALKMRSRVSESEALLDPNGLGGFTVLEWRVGLSQ